MSQELLLYKVVDALQLPIIYDGGKLSGSRDMFVDAGFGLSIPVKLTATALLLSDAQVAVLAHVCGSLSVLVAHHVQDKKGTTSAYLLDADKLEQPLNEYVEGAKSLRDIMKDLAPAVVKMLVKSSSGWKTYSLPF